MPQLLRLLLTIKAERKSNPILLGGFDYFQDPETMFKVVAGLGNPGDRYQHTKHNIGFLVLDRFCEGDGVWREVDGVLRREVRIGSETLNLVKPVTYMNCSGEPLARWMKYYRYTPEQLVVVHDDIDLSFGTIRIRQGGGDGGHNGIRSIVGSLGNPGFVRIRVGVGRPLDPDKDVADWVLQNFSTEESKTLPDIVDRAGSAILALFKDGLMAAQQRYSK